MNKLILLNLFLLAIGLYVIYHMYKSILEKKETIKQLLNALNQKKSEITDKKNTIYKLQESLINAENAHRFINELCYMQTYCHQRYIKIYQKELSYNNTSQTVYAVFYEDKFIYEMEYINGKKANST